MQSTSLHHNDQRTSGVSPEEMLRRRAVLDRDRAAALIMEPGIPKFAGPGAAAASGGGGGGGSSGGASGGSASSGASAGSGGGSAGIAGAAASAARGGGSSSSSSSSAGGGASASAAGKAQMFADVVLWRTVWADITGLSLIGLNAVAIMTKMRGWAAWQKIALLVLNLILASFILLFITMIAMFSCLADSACQYDIIMSVLNAGAELVSSMF